MADKFEFKVNYVRITEDGLEKFDDINFNDLTMEDRQDIKTLVFLPIDSGVMWDVTNMIKGFPFLENLYLPSMMTTEIKDIAKECPMLKSLVLLSHNSIVDSMDHSAVRVYSREEKGDNKTQFRAFVEHQKDGRQTFFVNTEHVTNFDRADSDSKVERLTLEKVRELVSGNDGVCDMITEINFNLTDDKYAIDLSKDTLESLFEIFVEKGVSFEEFTIDFSKMCDKIESYKSLAKNVNQVSIKEDVEGCIVSTYQAILQTHFNSIVKNLAKRIEKLITGTTVETEKYLISDLKKNIVNALVDHPSFDDNYESGNTLETILMDMSTAIVPHIRSSRIRGLARKYIAEVVSEFKNNRAELVEMIVARLKTRANVNVIFDMFAEGLGLELKKKSQTKLASDIVDILSVKNLGMITKEDVKGILGALKKKMGNEELRPKEIVTMLSEVVTDYPTIEEINDVLVGFIEKNGYSAIKLN